MSGLVSTIIPVYNRPDMLVESVNSVLEQSYPLIEIIIVDDGSTDNTPAVAEQLRQTNPDVIRTIQSSNRGPGPARESGRQAARGEFIQYLDSDDLLAPTKFETQVAALRQHPESGVAYGITRLISATGTPLMEPFKWTGQCISALFPKLLVDRWWCTHTPLYRRSVCDSVGAWSDLRYSQDWEYDARIGACHTQLVWCDTLVSEHRQHPNTRQTGSGKWLVPGDQIRFFTTLLTCARQAGISHTDPEMQHFSRWIFSQARRAGSSGEGTAAKALLTLAGRAGGGADRRMRMVAQASRLIGWQATGWLCSWYDRHRRTVSGDTTLSQSWMTKEEFPCSGHH